jgi:AraC-like DNA-binding protein
VTVAADRWELVRWRPHPSLRGHVLEYQGYREAGIAPFTVREVPRGFAVLIIGFGPPFTVGLAGAATPPQAHRSFFAGLHDQPALVGSTGRSHCLQLNLTPLGAGQILGPCLGEIANRTVALDDLLGQEARRLAERLEEADAWPARFALLEWWLQDRLAAAGVFPADLAWTLGQLTARRGGIAVAELAASLGCSRKHLSVRCRAAFGLPPKTLAGLLRFAAAVASLEREPGTPLAAIALASGYSDQPHFNRDFRRFAGLTPSAYLAARLPEPGGLLERR